MYLKKYPRTQEFISSFCLNLWIVYGLGSSNAVISQMLEAHTGKRKAFLSASMLQVLIRLSV